MIERLIAPLRQMVAVLWSWALPQRALPECAPDTLCAIACSRKAIGRSARRSLNIGLVIGQRRRTALVQRADYRSLSDVDNIKTLRSSTVELRARIGIQSKNSNCQDGQHTTGIVPFDGRARKGGITQQLHPVLQEGYHVLSRQKLAMLRYHQIQLRGEFLRFCNPVPKLGLLAYNSE